MKKRSEFHVVIIDDKKKACRRLTDRLSGLTVPTYTDLDVVVSVSSIHVTLKRLHQHEQGELDRWSFTEATLQQLLKASKRKADLLIVDYIYIDSGVAKHFKKKAKEESVGEEEIEHRALNPKLLYDWFMQTPNVSDNDRERTLNNLFHSDKTVYLHTYTPQGLCVVTGTMEQRSRMAALAFPQANIHVIDTRSELFNDEEFDWPRPDTKYDGDYYPYQLACFFAQVVQKEIFKNFLKRKPQPKRVFLVHGRSKAEKETVARFIEKLSVETVVLDEQANLGRSILKKFRDYSDVGFAVVLLTGDDKGGLASEDPTNLSLRARQNVIFELGFFLAKLGDDRVCCLHSSNVEIPSNYSGILYVPLDDSGAWKTRLARELRDAGFNIDLNKLL
ncbi:MAG: hypothetical protein FVQ84_19025 [Planctomycetes bacterium]|nr:hypothetical protein [Planctomycetota bacterium]